MAPPANNQCQSAQSQQGQASRAKPLITMDICHIHTSYSAAVEEYSDTLLDIGSLVPLLLLLFLGSFFRRDLSELALFPLLPKHTPCDEHSKSVSR